MLARRNRGSAQIDPPCRDRESSSTDSRKAPTRFGPFLCGHPPTIQFCLMPYTRRCLTEPGRDRAIGPRTRGPPRRLARERTAGRTLPGRAKGWMMGCCNRRGGNPSRGPPQILYASARRVAADADRTVFPICPYHRPSDLVRTFDHPSSGTGYQTGATARHCGPILAVPDCLPAPRYHPPRCSRDRRLWATFDPGTIVEFRATRCCIDRCPARVRVGT